MARCTQDLAVVYDVMQGIDTQDNFQADQPVTPCQNLLTRGQQGLRSAVLGGYFHQWSDDDAKAAVLAVAKALEANAEVEMPQSDLARSAAFIISASEGGNQYLPALRKSPQRFEPLSRERLLAGAMLPATWYVQAQRFRHHFANTFCRCSSTGIF